LLVTIPPLQMRNNVAMHVSHAKRLSNVGDLSGDVWIVPFSPITSQLTADYADDTNLIQQGNATSSRVLVAASRRDELLFRSVIFWKVRDREGALATQTANARRASGSGSEMLRAEAICLPLWEHQLGVRPASQLTRRAL
jgi:hypothetical protein